MVGFFSQIIEITNHTIFLNYFVLSEKIFDARVNRKHWKEKVDWIYKQHKYVRLTHIVIKLSKIAQYLTGVITNQKKNS